MSEKVNAEKVIRVLIADDHPVVREGFASLVADEPDMTVVGEAADGAQVLELFREHEPDVVLMDLRMPVMDGTTAIAALKREFGNPKVIVLTTFDGDEDIYRALRVGASGYLLKDAPTDELFDAIRAVALGKKRLQSEMAIKLAERVAGDQLTERELEVLQLMAGGKSNTQIGAELFIAETTVKFHVKNILAKLGATDRTQAVVIALRRGLAHI